jgi:thiamine biosynthesis lipoprotein ApbE
MKRGGRPQSDQVFNPGEFLDKIPVVLSEHMLAVLVLADECSKTTPHVINMTIDMACELAKQHWMVSHAEV